VDGALIVSWRVPRVGYEKQAIAYAREVDDVWGTYAAAGRCSEPEWFWSGRQNLWVVKGDFAELFALVGETQALLTKGRLLIEDFQYDLALTGREAQLAPYEQVLAEVLG
jgi:hypothetical protein